MKPFLLILLTVISVRALGAREFTQGVIKGKVLDEKRAAVPYATVILKNHSDSALVKGEMTDDNGSFTFDQLKEGKYFIEIQLLGYEKIKKEKIEITGDKPVQDLGALSIKPGTAELKTVNIIADKPFIERQIDKTVVNIENSIVQTGSSVMEVMEKLPGVQVNQDGAISMKGKQGVVIMMDNKPTLLSGQDLANMLKGMPSANLQKIELITNPSAKYEAAGNAGIINIVTKKNKREGMNGNVSAGYGQGRYEKANAAFSIGYKEKWYNIFFNYGFSHRKGFNNLKLNRSFYNGDTLKTVFETNDYIIFPFNTHAPRAGADFTLSKNSTLSVLGTGVVNSFNPSANNHTDILDGKNEKVNSYDFVNRSHDRWYNYAYNTEFRHTLDTTGREFTVDLDFARYWNVTSQSFTTTLNDSKGAFAGQNILLGDQNSDLRIYAAKADYVHPLKSKAKFEAGWKSSYVTADNNIAFYNNAREVANFDSIRSSHFLYTENINAYYGNLSKEFSKTTVQFGLRAEQTLAKGKQVLNGESFNRSYFQLFPSLFIDYKINEKHSINANVGRRIDRPAYQQMNPFRRMIDATTYGEGNPYLLPQISYNFELTHVFNNCFFTTIGYSITKDNITDVLIQDGEKRITVQTIVNLDQFNYFNLNLVFSKKLTKWWNTNTNFLYYYGFYTGVINKYNISVGRPSFSFNTTNNFFIADGLSLELSYYYNYKTLWGVSVIRENSALTAGIQKSVLKKQGTLTLNCSDIFWNAWPSGITRFGGVYEDFSAIRDTRVVNLNFTYRFGKGPVKMRRKTGADDEKNRTGNGM